MTHPQTIVCLWVFANELKKLGSTTFILTLNSGKVCMRQKTIVTRRVRVTRWEFTPTSYTIDIHPIVVYSFVHLTTITIHNYRRQAHTSKRSEEIILCVSNDLFEDVCGRIHP